MYVQGRLRSIVGPGEEQCSEVKTYATIHRNKNVNVDKITHKFIVLVLSTKSVFKH